MVEIGANGTAGSAASAKIFFWTMVAAALLGVIIYVSHSNPGGTGPSVKPSPKVSHSAVKSGK